MEKVAKYFDGECTWGLARDSLEYFTSPTCLIKFNYENYFGDCEKYIASSGLEELVFEQADVVDSKKENESDAQVGVLKEGFLLVDMHGESFVRNFKAKKRRYCVIRRNAEQQVILEIFKQSDPTSNKNFFAIKSAHLKTSNKQRTTILELVPASGVGQPPAQCLLLPADSENDIKTWFLVVDQALKDSNTNTDAGSSIERTPEPSLSEAINESLSGMTAANEAYQLARRPSATVESLLRPPLLKRKNLFFLYENVEPMCRPSGEPTALLEEPEEPYRLCTSDGHLTLADSGAPAVGGVDLSRCHAVFEGTVGVTISSNQFRIAVKCDDVTEQIEPFFLRVFLFDLASGQRISEELPITVTTDEFAQKIEQEFLKDPFKILVFGRLFSSCPADIYTKNLDRKALGKNQKLISAACKRLSDFRSLFAWTARPLQAPNSSAFTNDKSELPFYRAEGHLTDGDLKKLLFDFAKLQKSGKIVGISGAFVEAKVEMRAETVEVPLKAVNSMIATDFYRNVPNRTIEVAHLPSAATSKPKMLRSCINLLYVYPLWLAFGSQKTFSRARNIACSTAFVRLRDGKHEKAARILNLAAVGGPFVSAQHSAIQYHEQNPFFSDEIRVELPLDLDEGDHLLFSFTHVSLSSAQKQQNNEAVEQSVGFAWIPLVAEGGGLITSEDVQEFDLPVAASLPPDYCSHNPIGVVGKKHADSSSIKWVDGGKPLFRIRLRLQSALFTSNSRLNTFFQNCANNNEDVEWLLEAEGSPFEGVPFVQLLPHLPVVLNRVLQLFTKTGVLGLPGRVLKILLQLVDACVERGHKQELREFVRFHCAVGGELDANARALYEGILEGIDTLLMGDVDQSIALLTLKHLWCVLDICAKSMCQAILINGSHKYSRRKRFSTYTVEALESTFTAITQQILVHHQRFPAESRSANLALAYFAKHCLNIADRGIVFKVVYETIKSYDLFEMGVIGNKATFQFPRRFKLEMLQILASHEHWVPLNLPIVFDSSNKPIMNASSVTGDQASVGADATLNIEHFQLSRTYCKTHFLVGLLIQEFGMALRESRTYRRLVITLVRNLICKHGGDLRYDGAVISFHLKACDQKGLQTAQSRIAVLYAPLLRVILENIPEFEAVGRFEAKENTPAVENTQKAFDYPQMSARSIVSKEVPPTVRRPPAANGTATQRIASFAEKLDVDETKDLLLCCLYLLNNLPKTVIVALSFNSPTSEALPTSPATTTAFPIVHLLKLALRLFRCQEASNTKSTGTTNPSKKTSLPLRDFKGTPLLERSARPARKSAVQESHLAQETALIVLDVAHVLDEHLAARWSGADLSELQERELFNGLIRLKLDSHRCWLRTRGRKRCVDCASGSSFFLNSRLERVQAASAALLHLLIRQGFERTAEHFAKQDHSALNNNQHVTAEWLGNAGVQITTALAHLLGQNQLSADCPRFEHGLNLFESLTIGTAVRKSERFPQAAKDLSNQLRDILKATISISAARNDPLLLADLHVQLADSYRASPSLRIAWFNTLAQIHLSDQWFTEAAVCQAHCVAIIAKQLSLRDGLKVDFSLLDRISEAIDEEENVHGAELPVVQGSSFTLDALTGKVEETMKTLTQSERYEAIGPLCRLAIPIYEQQSNNRALMAFRASEIQNSGKRHLGAYFRVVPFSSLYFRNDHGAQFIYREPGLTSLAEACDRMVQLFRRALSTDHVRFLTDHGVDTSALDPAIAHIQITHVEPLCLPTDDSRPPSEEEFEAHLLRMQQPEMNFAAHTNVRRFYYEKPLIEPQAVESNEKISEQARLSLMRVFLTTEKSFPSTRRRLRVVSSHTSTLNPLMLACENLHRKTAQIQRILQTAGISPTGPLDRCKLGSLDVKGLQLILQGSVSPTVNVGVLAYAEAFTSESQRAKYGVEGIEKLKAAFQVFMSQLARALAVNEAAIGEDQAEYQQMLKNSFDGMVERLSTFFDGENFAPDQSSITPTSKNSTHSAVHPNAPAAPNGQRTSTYILDSISGLQRS
ncbi:Dedicator of cytokinesis protein 9 [Aphelenchoides fujianensis]|nr:Dedicator of cytokinesis protein 9 [Aphelenchoides fujianensis]